jgi:hypothetical protein
VRAQVDRDLTTVSWVDRLLGLIKNLGRHSLPSLTESRPEIRLDNEKMGRRTHGFEIAGNPDTGRVSVGARVPRAPPASGRGGVGKARGARTPRFGRRRPATRSTRARDFVACWRPTLTVLLARFSNSNFSKNLNKTRPSYDHES